MGSRLIFGIDGDARVRITVPACETLPGDTIIHHGGMREAVVEPGAIPRPALGTVEVCLRGPLTAKHQACYTRYYHPDTPITIDRPNLTIPGLED